MSTADFLIGVPLIPLLTVVATVGGLAPKENSKVDSWPILPLRRSRSLAFRNVVVGHRDGLLLGSHTDGNGGYSAV
jgi:hypothetical protein